MSDESVNIGGDTSIESYLRIDKIIEAMKKSNAEAVHPGYGFLSENVNFRDEVNKIGKTFIGPPSEAISSMGDKIRSKKIAKAAGVSVVPDGLEVVPDIKSAVKQAKIIGYPLMVKASAGGGGKGMRVAYNEKELEDNFNSAINEAKSSFGDERVFIEKFIEFPKHIEIQVLGDQFGNFIHLGEGNVQSKEDIKKLLKRHQVYL